MTHGQPARSTTRPIRRGTRVAGLLVVPAAIAAALGYGLPESSSSTVSPSPTESSSSRVASPVDGLPSEPPRAPGPVDGAVPGGATLAERRAARGEAAGAVPDGTTVFDDHIPGVANLDPALRFALRQAATVAADAGVRFVVDSGWRSPEYQERLRREAVTRYGSAEEAARWVATPSTSPHVSGDAVDVGPSRAAAWLSEHGAEFELCQIYRNEPWHYELRAEAADQGCPAMYADPTQDPRMQP